jgi:hypothetical protein
MESAVQSCLLEATAVRAVDPEPFVPAPAPATSRRATAVAQSAVPLAALGLGLWAMRGLLVGERLGGGDTPGHLSRIDWGVHQLLAHGHLDGWYPRALLGYQEYLLYGPGLTWMVVLVRLASLGVLDDERALAVVVVAAYVAVAPAAAYLARGVGIGRLGAWVCGLLALTVSSPRGGGLEGVFETGLVSQHAAVPFALVTLGGIARPTARPTRLAMSVTVGAGAVLVLTSTITAVLVGFVAPFVMVASAVVAGSCRSWRPWGRPIVAAALIGAVTGFWLVPFLAHQDLRGYIVAWDQPGLLQHLHLVINGRRGYGWSVAMVVLAAMAVALVHGIRTRTLSGPVLAAVPLGALAAAHGLQQALGTGHGIGVQLTNRGLVLYALLGLLPVGLVVDRVVRNRGAIVAMVATGLCVAVAAHVLLPLDRVARQHPTPVADLERTARFLAEEMAPGARFFALPDGEQRTRVGVMAEGMWLCWRADRDTLNSFVPEVAPGAGLAQSVFRGPSSAAAVDSWVEQVRRLAVSHLVASDPEMQVRLAAATNLRRVLDTDLVDVYELVATPGRPVASLLDIAIAPQAQHVDARVIDIRYRLDTDRTVPLTVGWSPKWHATVDGHSIPRRRVNGSVEVDLPAGTHDLHVVLRPDGADRLGLLVSLGTLTCVVGTLVVRRRRRPVQQPIGVIGPRPAHGVHRPTV